MATICRLFFGTNTVDSLETPDLSVFLGEFSDIPPIFRSEGLIYRLFFGAKMVNSLETPDLSAFLRDSVIYRLFFGAKV